MRRERTLAAWLAAVLVIGLVGVVVHDDPAGTNVSTAAPSAADDETTTTSVSTTLKPAATDATATPTPTTAKPRAAARPRTVKPSVTPAVSSTSPKVRSGDFGPRPAGSISFPYDPARTSWEADIHGVHMKLTIDRQGAPSGQPVAFNIEATTTTGTCCGLFLQFGDGTKFDLQPPSPCGSTPAAPGTRTASTTHPYNGEGRWEFLFQATNGDCGTYPVFYGWVGITAGTRTSNGPALPTIRGGWMYSPDGTQSTGRTVRVGGHGHDDDGFVHHFAIDWGDGATSTSPGDYMGCRPTPSGWPATSDAWYPPNGSKDPPNHTYAADGEYTVKVTVATIGCDGTDLQTATWTDTWRTAGPNP